MMKLTKKERAVLFGTELREARLRERFSVVELARIIGCNSSTYCSWESGKALPRTETLIKVCEILSIDASTHLIHDPWYRNIIRRFPVY